MKIIIPNHMHENMNTQFVLPKLYNNKPFWFYTSWLNRRCVHTTFHNFLFFLDKLSKNVVRFFGFRTENQMLIQKHILMSYNEETFFRMNLFSSSKFFNVFFNHFVTSFTCKINHRTKPFIGHYRKFPPNNRHLHQLFS